MRNFYFSQYEKFKIANSTGHGSSAYILYFCDVKVIANKRKLDHRENNWIYGNYW